jgi:glycerophosphoryl diester phosphodiesterase
MRSDLSAALALAICCAACEPRDDVLHPTFPNGGQLASASPLPAGALKKLEGMYGVSKGIPRFGRTVAVGSARDTTLSFFTNNHDNYAIFQAGCLSGGTQLVLEGYWRYASESDTGLLRVSVGPPAVAAALCSGSPLPTPTPPIVFDGKLGVANGPLQEPVTIGFFRPLIDTTGKFWVSAHHGACQTVDDCGASENSIPSLLMVESFGATDVEIDVRITADGVPILFHDDNFGPRLSTGLYCHGPVSRFTLADVRALCKLKFGEPVPTLEEALLAILNQTNLAAVWLDIKVANAIDPVVKLQAKYQALARQRGSKLAIVLGLGESDVLAAYKALKQPPDTFCLVELSPAEVRNTSCQFWGPRWTRGPMVSDVQSLQAENRYVMYWTIDDPSVIDLYLKQSKPNGLLSDRPGLVFHRFQSLGTLPPKERPLP